MAEKPRDEEFTGEQSELLKTIVRVPFNWRLHAGSVETADLMWLCSHDYIRPGGEDGWLPTRLAMRLVVSC